MKTFLPVYTKSLALREFILTDTPKILAMSQETSMRRWIPDQVYGDEKEAADTLRHLISMYSKNPLALPYVLGVSLKETNELIGHVGLSSIENGVEIGYAIGLKYQGKGYASEAVIAMSELGIKVFDLPSIMGIVASANIASCKVLEKSGFKFVNETFRLMHSEKKMIKTYIKSRDLTSI